MKFFGIELKFNGFDIFHKGNFNPDDKSNVGHKHAKSEITDFPSSMPANGGNADTVDGKHASDFATSGHTHTSLKVPDTRNSADTPNDILNNALSVDFKTNASANNPPVNTGSSYSHIMSMNGWNSGNTGGGGHTSQLAFGDSLAIRQSTGTTTWGPWSKFWHAGNDGSGSGLDADLLDGKHASDFAASTHSHDDAYEPKNTNIQSHISNKSNPHSVTKSQVGLGSVSNYGLATQAEAEAGTSSSKYMTPLRTKQAIDKFKPTKLSELENDIGAGGGIKITTSATAPTSPSPGDFWYKEV